MTSEKDRKKGAHRRQKRDQLKIAIRIELNTIVSEYTEINT